MQAYQKAKELCFGENTEKNPGQALEILKELSNSKEKDVAAKAAYLVAVINFTNESSTPMPWRIAALGPASSVQKKMFEAGLASLRQAHELGLEDATLLLGRMYAQGLDEGYEDKHRIYLDGEDVGTFVNFEKFRENRSYAFYLLQPLGEKNKAAAQVLGELAMDFFRFLNNPNSCEAYDDPIENEVPLGMICTETDLKMFYKKEEILNKFKAKKKSHSGENFDDDFRDEVGQEEISDLLKLFLDPEYENSMEALMFFMMAASGTEPELAKFAPSPEKLVAYEKKIWELRLLGCKNAIRWAQNALDLDCEVRFGARDLEIFKKLLFAYAQQRAEGKSAEFATQYMNEIAQERPLPVGCGCHVSSVEATFFANKPAARAPKPAAAEPDFSLEESPPSSP